MVGETLKRKITLYSRTRLKADLSGAEVAAKMLQAHGLENVKITCTKGRLTDHYNPLNKTVNLSAAVYKGRNAAAAAIAAHECGHAVQHAKGYAFLRFRSAMVPALSVTDRFMHWILLFGMIAVNWSIVPLGVGIALFSLTTLFSFVTLPVEFDASRRALAWIDDQRIVTSQERHMAKDALWWAATTYVVAALGSLAQLLYLINLFLQKKR